MSIFFFSKNVIFCSKFAIFLPFLSISRNSRQEKMVTRSKPRQEKTVTRSKTGRKKWLPIPNLVRKKWLPGPNLVRKKWLPKLGPNLVRKKHQKVMYFKSQLQPHYPETCLKYILKWTNVVYHCKPHLDCPETSREKITSIMHHTSKCHSFAAFKHFKQCEHGHSDCVKRPWFVEGTVPHQKMGKSIFGEDGRNLDDLKHYTGIFKFFEIS